MPPPRLVAPETAVDIRLAKGTVGVPSEPLVDAWGVIHVVARELSDGLLFAEVCETDHTGFLTRFRGPGDFGESGNSGVVKAASSVQTLLDASAIEAPHGPPQPRF